MLVGMAFYTDTLTAIQAAITARLAGGAVESYILGGDDISLCPLETLFKLESEYRPLAAAEGGSPSRISLADFRQRQ